MKPHLGKENQGWFQHVSIQLRLGPLLSQPPCAAPVIFLILWCVSAIFPKTKQTIGKTNGRNVRLAPRPAPGTGSTVAAVTVNCGCEFCRVLQGSAR